MSIARLIAAASITVLAGAVQAQDLMLFPPETFGQVIAPRNEAALDVQLEARVGDYNNEFVSNYGSESIFARTGRAVGMLQILTNVGHAPCTAFLVEGNKLVTNHHCVPGILKHPKMIDKGATSIAALQFHAGFLRDGIEEGVRSFHVNPVPLETSEALDYTVLQVLGDANADFGALELSVALPNDRDPFWVIGHPMGEAQRISREKCQADSPAVASHRLRHTCDTLPGNSGSPVIDAGSQKVIGLHHAGSRAGEVNFAVPMAEILAQSEVLKAAVKVPPKPVEPVAGELDAAFALADALSTSEPEMRIEGLKSVISEYTGTRAAVRATKRLEVEQKRLAAKLATLLVESGQARSEPKTREIHRGDITPFDPSSMQFDLDDRGLVRATPEGALTPEGLRIFSGAPPRVPPLRPEPISSKIRPKPSKILPKSEISDIRPRLRPEYFKGDIRGMQLVKIFDVGAQREALVQYMDGSTKLIKAGDYLAGGFVLGVLEAGILYKVGEHEFVLSREER